MHILLVEDDAQIAESMLSALKRNGYTPDWLARGEPALAAMQTQDYRAMILDLTLPDVDGLEVLRGIRQQRISTPILILSARADIEDKILGLDSGADDYLGKPFALDELLARLRVMIRRESGTHQENISAGSLTLNLSDHSIRENDLVLKLTGHEYKILATLILHAEKVVTKDQLLQCLHGWEEGSSENAIEVHIHHLRKKLQANTIQNIRGVGYILGTA